ncbi:hypothetical protein BD408DRAFT_464488 [Parasitella parasitica]|nr:hypothetical protein BD408DRAFT_464488 [Parasitella parasitica]
MSYEVRNDVTGYSILYIFTASAIFLFEDGHGNVVDENSGSKPMQYIGDQDGFVVEASATRSEYLRNAASNESSSDVPISQYCPG